MKRMLLMWIVWVVMAIAILAGVHYYFWVRLVRDVMLGAPWQMMATALLVSLAVSVPLAFVLGRAWSGPVRDLLVRGAFSWMWVMFLLLTVLACADLARGVTVLAYQWAGYREALVLPGHELLRARGLAGVSLVVAAVLSGLALWSAARPPVLKRLRVELARLPAAAHGITVAQLSDLHLGQPLTRAQWQRIVQRTNELHPDLVVITGDLVDGSPEQLGADVAPIGDLEAPLGVYFVTGNHEYYSGVEPWLTYLRAKGIRVLRNEHVLIGGDAPLFALAGVDDTSAHRLAQGHGEDVAAAVAGIPSATEIVLLAHQPHAIGEAAKHGVGLQISGHTHGGQIWPFTYLVGLAQPYVAGLHRHGSTQIYVSRGTGQWGPPMRLWAPAELTLFELLSPEHP